MKDMDMSFDFEEMDQFQKMLARVEKLPQKVVNKAAGKGATVAGRAVRAAAPRGKTKQLSKGFKRMAEKTRTKGKKVYRYGIDPDKDDIFQKKIPPEKPKRPPGKRRTSWNHAYYPSSVEYGFLARTSKGGLRFVRDKVEGKHFVRKAAESARPQVESTIIKTAMAELEKEWQKK